MRILIDADGCPVVDLTIRLAQQFAAVSYTHLDVYKRQA